MDSSTPRTKNAKFHCENDVGKHESHVLASDYEKMERELNEANRLTGLPCPQCKGRGGFDGDEDCFGCAWCNSTGIYDPARVKAEAFHLLDRAHKAELQIVQLREAMDKLLKAGAVHCDCGHYKADAHMQYCSYARLKEALSASAVIAGKYVPVEEVLPILKLAAESDVTISKHIQIRKAAGNLLAKHPSVSIRTGATSPDVKGLEQR